MGFLDRWEAAVTSYDIRDYPRRLPPLAASVYGPGLDAEAGSPVSADTALGIPAVQACLELVAGTVADLPVRVTTQAGEEVSHSVIGGMANQELTWQEFIHLMVGDALLYGDGLAYVERSSQGRIVALYHIPRSECDVTTEIRREGTGKVLDRRYRLSWKANSSPSSFAPTIHDLFVEDVFSLRGPGFNGIQSRGALAQFREQLSQTLSAERYGGRFYRGFLGTTAICYPMSIDKEQMQKLEQSFRERHHGIDQSHSTVMVDSGADIKQLDYAPREAQLIEARRFLVESVARSFGVPLGLLEYTSTSGVPVEPTERDMIAFSELTVAPWSRRVEDAVRRSFSSEGVGRVEMERSRIVVADLRTRAAAAKMYADSGILSINELRNIEDLPPLDDPLADNPLDYVREFSRDAGGREEGHEEGINEAETGNPIADSSPIERP